MSQDASAEFPVSNRLPADRHRSDSSMSRRLFIHTIGAGTLGLVGAGTAPAVARQADTPAVRPARNLIFVFLTGAPSQIDTWDPKPQADSSIRAADPPCATSVPGVWISENLPRMAQRLHQVSLVRSLHHAGPATHAAGQQFLMTGQCFYHSVVASHWGALAAQELGTTQDLPANVVLGGRLSGDLTDGEPGQNAAGVPSRYAPWFARDFELARPNRRLNRILDVKQEAWTNRERYGFTKLGEMLLQARRLVAQGVRIVTVNQFSSLLDQVTWDMHANGGRLNSTATDYRDSLCPELDLALSGLLDDLAESGLLSETVVAVCGEMGRTPRLNVYGGRDHHSGVWTGLIAGGPIRAGQVIGASDAEGAEPVLRPVTPGEYLATLGMALGLNRTGAVRNAPVTELF